MEPQVVRDVVEQVVRDVVEQAGRAPSVHNTQPWRFVLTTAQPVR
jgi:nitroreductase